MINTQKIRQAVKFAIKTHEVYEKQKRKGKDIPYITHPLTAGLLLASVGANEYTIIAGILHDTIEDSIKEKKVTTEMLEERFGKKVAELVLSVTEQNKELSWEQRKEEALEHIKTFSHDSLLVKSADVVSNLSELLDDYEKFGDETFERFNAPKKDLIQHSLQVIETLLKNWKGNPLAEDLSFFAKGLERIDGMVNDINIKKHTQNETELINDIKSSLLKEIENGKAHGLDVKKLWKDMQDSI
jgi:(p)ppGpp synthase/HD superfamily hydrolase